MFTEPASGIEPDPPVYEAGARPIELRGQFAAAEAAASRNDVHHRENRELTVQERVPPAFERFAAETAWLRARAD